MNDQNDRNEEEGVRNEEDRAEGARTADRDRALARLDETEIKARMTTAFDRFLKMGFSAHLIGVKVRGAAEYRIALYPDGTDTLPSEKLQEIADEFRLDYTIERDEHYDAGWAVMFYPRW